MSVFDKHGPGEVRRALFGGRGEVKVWNLGANLPPFSAVLGCELSAGGSVGRHQQQQDPELIIGLSGRGKARVDGREFPLAAGEVVRLPLGAVLEIENEATDVLSYLIVKARI